MVHVTREIIINFNFFQTNYKFFNVHIIILFTNIKEIINIDFY